MYNSIIHIITRLDKGGTVGVILPLAEQSLKLGVPVKIITGDTQDGREIAAKFPHLDIVFVRELVRQISPFKDVIALIKIIKIIYDSEYKIVHTHTSKAGVLGRIAAKFLNVPVIVHTPHGHVFHGYFPYGLSRLITNIEIKLASFADALIGISTGEIEETLSYGVGETNKFRLVKSGIEFPCEKDILEFDNTELKNKLGIKSGEKIIGYMGRLDEVKGIDILIKAFAELDYEKDNLKLLVCGDGSMMYDCKLMCEVLNIKNRVIFTGWIDNIWNYYSLMDIFVIPSRMEGMGKSAIEAIYSGVPVVANDVGGLNSIMNETSYGILTTPLNEKKIAEGIEKCFNLEIS